MTPPDWLRVSDAILGGGLVVLPSDTVYGLACLAADRDAIERIYSVKGRHFSKPLALVFTSVEQILSLAPDLPLAIADALSKLLPGPVTVIIPFKEGTGGIVVPGGGSAGVRIIPPPAGDIYMGIPGPLVVTSANLSGLPDPVDARDIPTELLDVCEFVVDAGPCGHGIPSTVVDLRPLEAGERPQIFRQGAMSGNEIEERLQRR